MSLTTALVREFSLKLETLVDQGAQSEIERVHHILSCFPQYGV